MSISDKTRKVLWGKSGNRCAICRRELVVEATPADDESVVGEECHIVSGKGQGPRHDLAFRTDCLDEPDNLVLLCRTHHKMVDDQHETYTAEVLHKIKANHEKWVSSTLTEEKQVQPVRIRRINWYKEDQSGEAMRRFWDRIVFDDLNRWPFFAVVFLIAGCIRRRYKQDHFRSERVK